MYTTQSRAEKNKKMPLYLVRRLHVANLTKNASVLEGDGVNIIYRAAVQPHGELF